MKWVVISIFGKSDALKIKEFRKSKMEGGVTNTPNDRRLTKIFSTMENNEQQRTILISVTFLAGL